TELNSRVAELAADNRHVGLEQRIAATQQTLEQLEQQQKDAAQRLVETRQREDATVSTVLDLQGNVADLKSQFAELAADNRYVALERSLSELASRTEATSTDLAALQARSGAVDEVLKTLDERLESDARKQENALSELKTSLLGQTSQTLGERFDAESRKQQQAFAELKASLLDQLSRTLDDRLDADEKKQAETLQQLHVSFVAEALRSLGEKLEAESVKQQQAIAELRASLAPQLPEASATPEARQAAPIVEHEAYAHQTHDHEAYAHVAHTDEAEGTLPPVIISEPHEDVLELEAAVPAAAAEATAPHDDHRAPEAAPPPFAESIFAANAAPAMAISAESLQPAAAFAHDDASLHAAVNPASILSAARQSLQAAAQKTEIEGKTKEFFSLPFMRSGGAREKGKSETTSYALLACVVLVAIIAVAVTAGELISGSSPASDVHPAPATARAAKLAPAVHATAKPVPAAAIKRVSRQANAGDTKRQLAVLASAGDSQAEMLLGLQQLSGPNKAQAAAWLQRAAVSGEPVAQYRLGTLYAEGRGVSADAARAFHWYSVAAQNGNRKAMSNLALAYAQGTGTAKNPVEAARWFSKAAQLGLVDAQFDLAILYERGLGVPQSLVDAYRWYLIAAKSGDTESKDRIEAIGSQLSPEDRAAAETAAAQFKPQPMNAHANEPQ
ncbi:MAG TPA: hypothetical protein VMF67_13555, partial [Rhizomicrobium sp.]|nr:hypothetical protein [Rhizomicrobium sp.]